MLSVSLGAVAALALSSNAHAQAVPEGQAKDAGVRLAAPRAERDPLVRRLCDVLHALPAARKHECCGTTASSLAASCVEDLDAAARSGALRLDGSAIERCARQSQEQLQGCGWVTPRMPPLPEECRNVVGGRLEAGARCRSSLECRDGLHCRGAAPARGGVCSPPSPAGGACETPADNLMTLTRMSEAGFRHPACEGVCVKGRCLAPIAAGGSCRSSSQCRPGLHCIAGRCQDQPLPRVGESCAGGTACGTGSYCEAGSCAALKGSGEPCRLPFECRAGQCVKAGGAAAGACADPCAPFAALPPG